MVDDGLDLLKKDWKKREGSLPHFSYNEIYKLLWKRSSSIVKWIFIISIAEFLFWAALSIILSDKHQWEQIETLNMTTEVIVFSVISYLITFYFIFCFYKNYKRISVTDNIKMLIKNILKTRKTVKRYIGFVLISNALLILFTLYKTITYHVANTVIENPETYEFDTTRWLILIGMTIGGLVIFLGLLWLFYRLIYGILLRRLNKNYKELKKLEV